MKFWQKNSVWKLFSVEKLAFPTELAPKKLSQPLLMSELVFSISNIT